MKFAALQAALSKDISQRKKIGGERERTSYKSLKIFPKIPFSLTLHDSFHNSVQSAMLFNESINDPLIYSAWDEFIKHLCSIYTGFS